MVLSAGATTGCSGGFYMQLAALDCSTLRLIPRGAPLAYLVRPGDVALGRVDERGVLARI
jgi:hypothetical protein